VKQGLLTSSPVAGLEKAIATPRMARLTDDEWQKLWEAAQADSAFREAILFMRLTGCRPLEMRQAEKRHFDPSIPAIVYQPHEWKCGEKRKRKRIIRLVGEALTIVQRRCEEFPVGPIFRNCKGTPWQKDGLARKVARLRKKLDIPHLVPYSIRHTYATKMVFHVNSVVLAELMGTSVKMLESVYADAQMEQGFMGECAAHVLKDL
jgi:integrase